MSYSPTRFLASFGVFTASIVLLVFLVLSSQITMAVLPAVGMGGVFLDAQTFRGENAVAYPQYGQLSSEYPDKVTDTATCKQRPVLALRINDATVDGYSVFKDIKLPFFEDQWMSVTIKQPQGSITTPQTGTVTIFATQLQVDSLKVDNVKISEGNSGPRSEKWGPNSGEFLLEGDPSDNVTGDDIDASGIKVWTHAITGDRINFNSPNGFTLEVDYNTTSDLQARYDNMGLLQNVDVQRENYFDCLPGQPELRESPLVEQGFEGFPRIPNNWVTQGNAVASTNTSDTGSYSVRLDGENDILATPNLSISNSVGLSVNYWVRQGDSTLGDANLPETTEYLVVEFRGKNGEWNAVDTFEGGSVSGGEAYNGGFTLPEGAYHSDFAVRFRTKGGTDGFDHWFIDNVEVG
jgi:hypothetical protein